MAAGGIPPNANKAGGVTDRRDFEASFRYAPFGFKIFPNLRIHYFGCFPTALFLTFPQDRDALVHNLANIPYNDNAVREVAERGKKLIDTLSNRVKSVNNYYKKLYAEQEKAND